MSIIYDQSLNNSITGSNDADRLKTNNPNVFVTVSNSNPPTAGQALVFNGTDGEWTDISVPLVDNLTFITDALTPSNRIGFDATGSGNTTLTLRSQTTSNKTVTFPDITDTLVTKNSVDVLTNKTLTNPIISNIINGPGSNITLPPNQVTQLVGRNTLDVLTNKTIAGNTNFVAANSLRVNASGSPLIDVSAGIPPASAGLVLKTVSTTRADFLPETVTTLSNQGTTSLVATGTGPSLGIKGLVAGTGITLSSDANNVTINSTTTDILDTNFIVSDAIDTTKKFKFDVGGSTNTLTTLATVSSANHTLFLPNSSGFLVEKDLQETLTNKSVLDNSFNVRNQTDTSIRLNFDLSQPSTNTSTTIKSTNTLNRVIELPDENTQLIGDDSVHSLTNKTITGTTNIVESSHLRTASGAISVNTTNPSLNQVLTFNGTNAVWQDNASANPSTLGSGSTIIADAPNNRYKTLTAGSGVSFIATANDIAISAVGGNLVDNTTFIVDAVDATKRIGFDAAGTTGTTTTLVGTQTANRTLQLPDISDTLVTRTAVETLSNKSLIANNTSITDLTTPTKRITFDCVNNQPNMRTIFSTRAVITNQTFEFPPITSLDTVVTNGWQANLTNKTLDDASILFRNTLQSSRTLRFSVANTVNNTQLTLISPITANRSLTFPDLTDTLVSRTSADTLTNKNLSDATTFIVDSGVPSTRIGFNAAGTPSTTTTLASSQTANRTLTLPDITDTLVTRTATETRTNKSVIDTSFNIRDSVDNTIRLRFEAGGTTGTDTMIRANQSSNVEIVLPDATTTLIGNDTLDILTNKTLTLPIISQIQNTGTLDLPVGTDTIIARATTDTLTNKTIIDASNNVAANSLKTTGASVNVASAAPPSAGQVLKATSTTTATWQNDNNTATTLTSAGGAQTLIASTSAYPNFAVKSLQVGDYMSFDTLVTDQLRISSYDGVFTAIKTASDTQDLYTLHGKQKNYHIANNNASPINVILPVITNLTTPDPVLIRIGNDICVSSSSGSLNLIDILNPADSSVLLRLYPGSACRFIARALGASGYVLTSVHGSFLGNSSNNIIQGVPTITATSTNTISLKTAGSGISGLNSCVAIGANALDNSSSTGNVAIGVGALQVNQTANNNTSIGYQCGTNLLGGVQQGNAVAIGYRSCYNSPFGAGSVSIGAFSTQSGSSTGSLVIGNESSRDNVPGTYSVIVGANQNVSTSSGANTIMVGSDNTSAHANAILLGTGIITNNANDILIGNSITPAGINGKALFIQSPALGQVPSGSLILGLLNSYPTTTTPNDICIVGKSNSIANQTGTFGGQINIFGRSNSVSTALLTNTNANVYGSGNIIADSIIGAISIFGSGNTCNSQSGPNTLVVGLGNVNQFGSNVLVGIGNTSQASSQFCVALGRSCSVATQGIQTFPSVAVGDACTADVLGGGAIAMGIQSSAIAPRSLAIGFGAQAKSICTNMPQPLACKPAGAILQSDAHFHFGSAACSYTTSTITGAGAYDFTIGVDNSLLFCPFSIMVVNAGTGTGNITFSVGTPADVTLYRVGVTVGTLTAYQMWSEEMTNAKRQNTRAVGVTGNTVLRVNVTAWSTTLATFAPRVTIIGHAYQL